MAEPPPIHLVGVDTAVAPENITELIMVKTSGACGDFAGSVGHQKDVLSRADHANGASGIGVVLILLKRRDNILISAVMMKAGPKSKVS